VASINAASYSGASCNAIGPTILDRTSASLYVASLAGDCGSTEYESFEIDRSTGELTFLGSSPQVFLFNSPLSFLSNNKYAYGSDCINFQGNYTDTFSALFRATTRLLMYANLGLPVLAAKGGDTYCPNLTAADPSGHLAVSMQTISGGDTVVGAPQIATYTADSSGNLTTKSTASNMPSTKVLTISTLAMSPSGKLLVVGAGVTVIPALHGGSGLGLQLTGR
jgi:hypothetical protein